MRVHKRTPKVRQAANEIGMAIGEVIKKHDLTYAEVFSILGGEIQGLAKYQIRDERHPNDPDKAGDEA